MEREKDESDRWTEPVNRARTTTTKTTVVRHDTLLRRLLIICYCSQLTLVNILSHLTTTTTTAAAAATTIQPTQLDPTMVTMSSSSSCSSSVLKSSLLSKTMSSLFWPSSLSSWPSAVNNKRNITTDRLRFLFRLHRSRHNDMIRGNCFSSISTSTSSSGGRSWNISCPSQPLPQSPLPPFLSPPRPPPERRVQQQHLSSRMYSSSSSTSSSSSSSAVVVQAVDVDNTTATTTAAKIFSEEEEETTISISKIIKSLPPRLLQDDDLNTFDTDTTFQRNNVLYEYESGKPMIVVDGASAAATNLNIVNWKFHEDRHNKLVLIEWNNGVTTKHDVLTLKRYYYQRQGVGGGVPETVVEDNGEEKDITSNNADEKVGRVLWTNLTEDDVRQSTEMSMTYETLISGGDDGAAGMKQALKSLYQYGIALITNTPTDDPSAIAALGAALSGGSVKTSPDNSMLVHYLQKNVRGRGRGDSNNNNNVDKKSITVLPDATDGALRTLYGSVWSTSSGGQADGTSVADSAYGNDGLPLHTDMTYLRDPPGLQIFTMVQPALKGGESVFGDGFAVADELRRSNPDAFHTLSTTTRRYHSRDEITGWHLQASGPVIDIRHDTDGRIECIRHNDLDRLPDIPPSHLTTKDEINDFYDKLDVAHQAWDTLLSQDKFRLVMKLRPGDTMVVANQRCFHGRCSFESNTSTPRSVIGCYVSQDELLSRMRMEGYDV